MLSWCRWWRWPGPDPDRPETTAAIWWFLWSSPAISNCYQSIHLIRREMYCSFKCWPGCEIIILLAWGTSSSCSISIPGLTYSRNYSHHMCIYYANDLEISRGTWELRTSSSITVVSGTSVGPSVLVVPWCNWYLGLSWIARRNL